MYRHSLGSARFQQRPEVLSAQERFPSIVSGEFAQFHIAALFVLAFALTGCSKISSNPTPPVTLTIKASESSIDEISDSDITFTVETENPVIVNTSVTLSLTGTATEGIDYELSATEVQIPAQQSSATVTLTPIRDWEAEQNESAVVSIQPSGNTQIAGSPSSATIRLNEGPIPRDYKESLSADLRVYSDLEVWNTFVSFELRVWNFGVVKSSPTSVQFVLRKDLRNSATTVYSRSLRVPELDSFSSFTLNIAVLLFSLPPNDTYYGFALLDRTPEETSDRSRIGWDYVGFSVNPNRRVAMECQQGDATALPGSTDPLYGRTVASAELWPKRICELGRNNRRGS